MGSATYVYGCPPDVPPAVVAATDAAPAAGDGGMANRAVVPALSTSTSLAGTVTVAPPGCVTSIDVAPGMKSAPASVAAVPPATGPDVGINDDVVGASGRSGLSGVAQVALASTILPTEMSPRPVTATATSRKIDTARPGISMVWIVPTMSTLPDGNSTASLRR